MACDDLKFPSKCQSADQEIELVNYRTCLAAVRDVVLRLIVVGEIGIVGSRRGNDEFAAITFFELECFM